VIYFVDASALVKRYVAEHGSDVLRGLVRRRRALAASRISSVEVPAAIWKRARAGDLAPDVAKRISSRVARDLAEMRVVEVRTAVLDRAAALVERRPLRAYDAVQLASAAWLAAETGLAITFACSDAALSQAAAAEGLHALRVG
jgi:predicted nucleic acid-binding protein